MSSNYFQHHLKLLQNLNETTQQGCPSDQEKTPELQELLNKLEFLAGATQVDEQLIETGQQTLRLIVAAHPELMPVVHRDLFWFFAGDCLHFMPDEEISRYQQLEDKRYEAESQGEEFDYQKERAKIFGLH